MIDEMQDTIDAQKGEIEAQKNEIDKQKEAIDKQHQTIEELQTEHKKALDEVYEKSIRSTVSILRSLNIPEQEIILQIGDQHQLSKEQVQRYL